MGDCGDAVGIGDDALVQGCHAWVIVGDAQMQGRDVPSSKGPTVYICAIFSILIAVVNSFEYHVDVTHFLAGSMMTLIGTCLIPWYVQVVPW